MEELNEYLKDQRFYNPFEQMIWDFRVWQKQWNDYTCVPRKINDRPMSDSKFQAFLEKKYILHYKDNLKTVIR